MYHELRHSSARRAFANEIGDEGAVTLAEALRQMPRLCHLNLRDNKTLGQRGREALENAPKIGVVVH